MIFTILKMIVIFQDIVTTVIYTTSHIPRNVWPLLVKIMASELRLASKRNIWSTIRLHKLPKFTLGLPHRGGKKHHLFVSSAIKNHLLWWHDGDMRQLWLESKSHSKNHNHSPPSSSTNKSNNIKKAIMRKLFNHKVSLTLLIQLPLSTYRATTHRILSLHPFLIILLLWLCHQKWLRPVNQNFPKDRVQEYPILDLFEPICGSWGAPAYQECHCSLTLWLNHLLSGNAHPF